jgi:cold-inducible RNA-binding protein
MTTKLYVANVPLDTTEDALRRHFATCGGVSDVELLTDRNTGAPRGLARVTMTSPSYAAEACAKLDGAPFGTGKLRVSESPIKAGEAAPSKVKIVQQFRERGGMVYDFDCAGLPLTVRMVQNEDETWSVEARSTEATDATSAIGTAKTRAEAFAEAVRSWNATAAETVGRALDGDALTKAMRDVRAI